MRRSLACWLDSGRGTAAEPVTPRKGRPKRRGGARRSRRRSSHGAGTRKALRASVLAPRRQEKRKKKMLESPGRRPPRFPSTRCRRGWPTRPGWKLRRCFRIVDDRSRLQARTQRPREACRRLQLRLRAFLPHLGRVIVERGRRCGSGPTSAGRQRCESRSPQSSRCRRA